MATSARKENLTMNPSPFGDDEGKSSDRDRKTAKRPMPVHGQSMKRLLNERAAKAQARKGTTK
jgi:hypothetical protein